jgi:cellulose synthase/poly-beta-1,6-N-acetylglucosamine synthase-like glycosyltransferase
MLPITIIIPAHNEASMIAATLAALAPIGQTASAGHVIVACNGCTDGTEAIAQAAAPAAHVLAIAERGKAGAINRALAHAADGAVIVLDGDIRVTAQAIAALAAALAEPGVMAASLHPQFVLDRATWPVRAFYQAFAGHPYLDQGVGGSGIYGLSAAGRAALGPFPAVVADDQYVRSFFPLSAQRRVGQADTGGPLQTLVLPPPSLGALLATERRTRVGVAEVRRLLPHRERELSRATALRWLLGVALRQPVAGAMFLVIKAWAGATAGRFRPGAGKDWTTLRA